MLDKNPRKLHIVFQVLNFLYCGMSAPYNLNSDEKLLLLTLAHHQGPKGIYPAISTLARELKVHSRSILRTLKKLSEKNLIKIQTNAGKSSNYFLTIPEPELSTTPDVHVTPDINVTPDVDVTTPLTCMSPTPDVDVTLSTYITTKKINIEGGRKNRGRKKRASSVALPENFEAGKIAIAKAIEVGLTEGEANVEFELFKNYYTASGILKKDWQPLLSNWFIRAGKHKEQDQLKLKTKSPAREEPRSTVPWYNPDNKSAAETLAHFQNEATIRGLNGKHERNGKRKN